MPAYFPDESGWPWPDLALKEAFTDSFRWRHRSEEFAGSRSRLWRLYRRRGEHHGELSAWLDELIRLALIPGHPFAMADGLHPRLLKAYSPGARDAWWSIELVALWRDEDSTLSVLVRWASESALSGLHLNLAVPVAQLLAWTCAVSQQALREQATRGLTRVLVACPDALDVLLADFLAVNDDYVVESVLVATWGVLIDGSRPTACSDAARRVWEVFFAFDTANQRAQTFQTAFQRQYGSMPDWVATVANDAMRLVLVSGNGHGKDTKTPMQGVTGALSVAQGQLELPIQMGLYNGDRLISAPVQLLPIAKGVGFDYIDALKQGRVLYVNDRFMYKTNVVYVGTAVHGISEVNPTTETAMIDMSVWFRYRGSFSPQDLLITNAAEPFTLDKPEETIESSDIQYRRYRFKKKFQLNFTRADRPFNQQVAGITFRHRHLNRNNLTYVVDVLGMPAGAEFVAELHKRNLIMSTTGLRIVDAWMSQEQVQERGDGAPQYVGMTGEKALFSTITMGLLLKSDGVSAHDIIPSESFIYVGIFGVVGVMFAVLMDSRRWGRYWSEQSWVMRVIFVPLLLAALGNLVLDQVFLHAGSKVAGLLMLVYDSVWWLMGAYLADMAVRRFVWTALEERAQRQIPNIMKFLVSFLFLALAAGGITAFVLNQPLTSLLATSGVFAMVIGFAVQANIANIFSGILLNVERPFKVGDMIRVNNMLGTVEDISWRTTRIKANDGQMISLANSKISEALTENLSNAPTGLVGETLLYVRPEIDRGVAVAIIKEAIDGIEAVLFNQPGKSTAPKIVLRGLESLNGQWVATYSVKYRVATESKKSEVRDKLWTRFGQLCKAREIASVASSAV